MPIRNFLRFMIHVTTSIEAAKRKLQICMLTGGSKCKDAHASTRITHQANVSLSISLMSAVTLQPEDSSVQCLAGSAPSVVDIIRMIRIMDL